MARSRITAHDRATTDVFSLDGYKLDKGLVLLADYYRQSTIFPMDKLNTPRVNMLSGADRSCNPHRYGRRQNCDPNKPAAFGCNA